MMQRSVLSNFIVENTVNPIKNSTYDQVNPIKSAQGDSMKTDSDMLSENGDALARQESEKSNDPMMALFDKQKFYEFMKASASSTQRKSIFDDIRKGTTFKLEQLPDDNGMCECFEKVYAKCMNTSRQGKKNWTEEESTLLISIMTLYCAANQEDFTALNDETWPVLASILPGKKAEQIKHRWQSSLRTNLSKAPWSATEDQILIDVMKKKTDKTPWRDVAAEVNQRASNEFLRTGKQCSERWTNHLDPNINRGAWTEEEDIKLFKCFLQTGKKWSELSKLIENRTENAVKNRFNSLIRKFQKEETLVPNSQNENDELYLKRMTVLILSQNRLGNSNNQVMQEYETKQENIPSSQTHESGNNLEKMSIEISNQSSPSKKKDPDPSSGTIKPGHQRKPSRVDLKKNLLKSIIQQEPQVGFPQTQQQNTVMTIEQPQPNNVSLPNLGAGYQSGINNMLYSTQPGGNIRSNWESFGKAPNYYLQQNQQFNNQQALSQMNINEKIDMIRATNNQNSLSSIYGGLNYIPNSQGVGIMDMNSIMTRQSQSANPILSTQQQEAFVSNQLISGANFNYFQNPLAGLSYLSGTLPQNNDFGQSFGQNNIIGGTNFGLPISSPSLLKASNNSTLSTQNFQPMDANVNGKSSFSSEERKQNSNQDGALSAHNENPIGIHQAKPTTEIKRELTQKNFTEFNPESVIKPNSNKIMFAVIDNEKNLIYPINPVTLESYKSVIGVTKLNHGKESPLFASPLSLASDFANSNLIGNAMDIDNVAKLKGDYNPSLTFTRQIQGSPSLAYFNSLLTGRRPDGSPDSFLCLRSPTLLGGSLGRLSNSAQQNAMMDQSPPIFFKP